MVKINRSRWLITLMPLIAIVIGILTAHQFGFTSEEVKGAESTNPQATKISTQNKSLVEQLSFAFEKAAEKTRPSVVPIFAEQVVEVQNPFGYSIDPFRDFFGDDFFKRFFGTPNQGEKKTIHSLGSGVIVTEDGYILTNNHVVKGADKLTVVLENEKKYKAEIVGTDPQSDVAVIKIRAKNLPAAQLGNSDELKVGQWVIAVGNPFQLMHTVTAGIISAKGRSSVGLADYEDFIQTDAAINPGNSGGALADLNGDVIGINTAISTPSGGNVGIGFAIPINMAKHIMDALINKGKVTRGYLGVLLQNIDEDLAKALNLKGTKGALVGDVTPDGPADKAGIERGDVIIKFNGKQVDNTLQLRNWVADTKPGTSVKLGLIRDGQEREVKVVLGERPKERLGELQREEKLKEESYKKLGLSIQTLTSDLAQQLGYQNDRGVVVTDVKPGSPAEDSGLQPRDLIKEVNKTEVKTVQDFKSAVAKLKSGETAAFLVRRGQNTFFVPIKMP